MRYGLIDAASIKELRKQNVELARKVVAVCALNTAIANENAKLRAENKRLLKNAVSKPKRKRAGII
jgi:hypothetical protein